MKTMTREEVIENLVEKVEDWDVAILVEYAMDGMLSHYVKCGNDYLLEEYNDVNADGDPDDESFISKIKG